MAGVYIIIGVVWLVIKLADEASWSTNAYKNREYDVSKAFQDACVNGVSKREFKRNYRNGKYCK